MSSKPHVQHPQKGPTRIDPKALQDLADKAGFDLVPKGRQMAFHVQQAIDPLRADLPAYREAIYRSMVRQMADFLLERRAVEVRDVTHPGGAISTRGTLVVVAPEPPPAAPTTTDEDPLS